MGSVEVVLTAIALVDLARRPADNLAPADLVLADEERARLDRVSQQPLRHPHWHQRNTARDRLGAVRVDDGRAVLELVPGLLDVTECQRPERRHGGAL